MDVEDQIDKALDDKELDYGLSEDSNWGLRESIGLSFTGMEPPSMTKTDHKTPSKCSTTRSPSRLQDNMIMPEHRENDEAKNRDQSDTHPLTTQEGQPEDTDTRKDFSSNSHPTSDVEMDISVDMDSSAISKSTPDPLFNSGMTYTDAVKKCSNSYQLLQVNSRKNCL